LYSRKFAGLAIAAYERTLLANQAPFQRWLKGQYSAMTDMEKRGAIVFFNQGNCVSCHTGPALNSMAFYALGMNDLYTDGSSFNVHAGNAENLGRGGFTKRPEDMYKFKVPQLYNLKDSPQYGHGASFKSIKEVLEYKNKAIKQNSVVPDVQLADEFVPLLLTPAQIEDLNAFITFGLRDPYLKRYQPDDLLSGNCIPNNDPKSRSDLGCE
jgi:cytochrome c peroxidase